MTIYGAGYRGLEYEPTGGLARIWPIAWLDFTAIFRTKRGLLLFLASLWYVLPKVGFLYAFLALGPENPIGRALRDNINQLAEMSPPGAQFMDPMQAAFYLDHATRLGFWVFLLFTALVSVRSIAADKGANALEIYWTRGISPFGYFVGKWLGSFVLFLSVFAAGPLVLWILGLLIAPDWEFLQATIGFVPQAVLVLSLQCLVLSFLAVAFSTLTSSANLSTFLWVGVLVGSWAMSQILTVLAQEFWARRMEVLWYKAIWIWDSMHRTVYEVCGVSRNIRSPGDYDASIAGWAILVYVCVGVVLVWQQLRAEKAIG